MVASHIGKLLPFSLLATTTVPMSWEDASVVMVSSGELTPTKESSASAKVDVTKLWTKLEELQKAVASRKSPEMKAMMTRLDELSETVE